MIHLIRRLKKKKEKTEHEWCDKMIELLSDTNKDRNKKIKEEKDMFENDYLKALDEKYLQILEEAKIENESKENINYFKKEEKSFINDLVKYKDNSFMGI